MRPGQSEITAGTHLLPPARFRTFAVTLILIMAAALRFIDLERVPPPFNVDEALHAYEAYSIMRTGKDEWGRVLPVTFRAFNDYRRPATIYSAVPFIALFGLTVFAIRAMAAFWGWLAVLLTYQLARDLFDEKVGLAAALLLALSSWHVGFSRLGVEASGPLLPVILAGLDLGWRWSRNHKRSYLIAASFMFGLSLYTYTITQALTPLLLFALGLIFWRSLRTDLHGTMIASLVIALIAIPLAIAILTNPGSWNRFNAISVFSDPEREEWIVALRQWVGHFSPEYLFLIGDASPIHHIQGFGQLYWIEMLLVPVGLAHLFHKGRDPRAGLLILAWLAISAVPSALTRQDMGSPNSMRGITGVAAWAILSGIGLAFLMRHSPRLPHLSAVRSGIILGILLWNASLVLHDYFTIYPIRAARAFEYGIGQVMDYVSAHENEVDTIVLTDWISQPHIFAVFYEAYDPREFQRTHAPYGNKLSEKLTAWGEKYRAGDVEALYRQLDHGLFVARPHMLTDVEPILVISHPDGSPAFKIIRK